MNRWDEEFLDELRAQFVAQQLEEPRIVQDMSWGLVDTKVFRVRDGDQEVVVKAAGPAANHHIGREITAHESYTGPLVELARTGRLIAADRAVNVLIIEYQAGELVEGTPNELDPDVHAQAGSILRAFHAQTRRLDDGYEQRATAKAVEWLNRAHRVEPHVEAEARQVLLAYRSTRSRLSRRTAIGSLGIGRLRGPGCELLISADLISARRLLTWGALPPSNGSTMLLLRLRF